MASDSMYDWRMIVADMRSTRALSRRASRPMPLSSIVRWASTDVTHGLRRRAIHLRRFAEHYYINVVFGEIVCQITFELFGLHRRQRARDDPQRVAHRESRAPRTVVYRQNASHT